ncbi:hypothetical protein N7468_003531 [Penicillium chermesinum]|uniref:Uncharacterized protein n=1 Tax=Penicillium chermesinum TaxID=63820 RepID=A0A9W9TRW5_9EURO|nr:uncharacterized protein N7468_003531 [Penicillium chermesinum]KAJ5238912.1 hypothetical protein N7468_003531 [Penicillium chermesinum]KAJ6164552.1 hypothetical protein N7470_003224 [Penicillium chermesinum]
MRPFLADLPEGHGSVYKEVRFSPTATPLRRAQSLSAAGPAKSRYNRPSILERARTMDSSHLDLSQDLLKKQQKYFQAERELFDEERRLWEKERSLLRSRIDELEAVINDRRGRPNGLTSRPSFGSPPFKANDTRFQVAQVWEGTSPGSMPTRVFRDGDVPESAHSSPIVEVGILKGPSLDAALSPQASAIDGSGTTVSVPVPIEKLDSKLDGITLKSTALPAGVVARVITPPSPSSQDPSPSGAPSTAARPAEIERRNSLRLKLSELGPPNENLVRNAGHTPMAIIEADGSLRTTQEATPLPEPQEIDLEEEAPLAPAATHLQPSENAQSYFPDVPDDPALTGPLGLTNDEELDNSFLNVLDQKLLDQARRILSTDESADPNEEDSELPSQGEQEPEIKFKNSTNFGTAFGTA